jgi:hypothetical protein
MEVFDNQENKGDSGSSLFGLNLDIANSYNLRTSGSWAKVLGVVGIILGAIFIIIFSITLSQLNSYDSSYSYRREGLDDIFSRSRSGASFMIWIFILTGVLFIVGGIFSYNFGQKIGNALRTNDQNGLNAAFAALRNYFALRSIVLIVLLLLVLVLFSTAL